ncbi:MAG: hypothetical protein WC935_00315 [Thermoleophilia bacterium]
MNRIHLMYPKTNWRPTYFMWSDLPQREDDREALISHIVSGEECYVRADICEQLLGKWRSHPVAWLEELPEWVHPWQFHVDHLCASPGKDWPEEWCFPKEDGVLCKLGTGMGPMMQQAIKMGYNELYLVGCDLDWHVLEGDEDTNHFDRAYEANLEIHTEDRAKFNNELGSAMHDLIARWCKEHGVWVFNATVGGSLDVYPRVSLEEVCAASF